MKLGLNIVATVFTFALSLACAAGCATSTEPTDDDDSTTATNTGESSETPPPVESGKITPSAYCGYTSAQCALAISKCPNPQLGGTYCYIAQKCFACY